MERTTKDILLEYIDRAAFYVQNGIIIQANHAAQQKGICIDTPVSDLLGINTSVYESFTSGSLYMTIFIHEIPCGAAITRSDKEDIFLLDEDITTSLRALALSAQQLRIPLQNAFAVAEALQQEKRQVNKAKELTKGLFQMHRIICNMSDTFVYNQMTDVHLVATDLSALFYEIMEKCSTSIAQTGIKLHYDGPFANIVGLADSNLLERAIYNLVSNAVKFSSVGSTIAASLKQSGNLVRFTLRDHGCGIPAEILGGIFSRYLRNPGVEDGRHGIGLGMALIRAAAVTHGGTVLIDQPDGQGTRVTVTLALTQDDAAIVRSPIRIPTYDYAGGYDHTLLELSDVLPADTYKHI